MSGSGGGVPSSAIWRAQAGSQAAASFSWPGCLSRTLTIQSIAFRTKATLRAALM